MTRPNGETRIWKAAVAAIAGGVTGVVVVSAFSLLPGAAAGGREVLVAAGPVGAAAGALLGLACWGSYRVFRALEEAS